MQSSPSLDILSKLGPLGIDVFREILRNKYGAGWSIARSLGKDPSEVGNALGNLKNLGLVDTEGASGESAIDGLYYPTSQGLSLWENLNTPR
jgi:predicted transcriptional regulator